MIHGPGAGTAEIATKDESALTLGVPLFEPGNARACGGVGGWLRGQF
jgi:hypothetical protein